jgi:NhaA family Na+:H+ antiporter
VWAFAAEYSVLLRSGTVSALIRANTDVYSDHAFVEFPLVEHAWIGHLRAAPAYHVSRALTVHCLIDDVLMARLFAMAGKEAWEAAALSDGSLRGKTAMNSPIATVGGVLKSIAIYRGIAMVMGSTTFSTVANGSAIPAATDTAFSDLIGRLAFGAGRPPVRFLLPRAIADDAAGLIILAIFHPSAELAPAWLPVSVAAPVRAAVRAEVRAEVRAAIRACLPAKRLPRILDGARRQAGRAWCASIWGSGPMRSRPARHGRRSSTQASTRRWRCRPSC